MLGRARIQGTFPHQHDTPHQPHRLVQHAISELRETVSVGITDKKLTILLKYRKCQQ